MEGKTPVEAKNILEEQSKKTQNLEEKALSLVGEDIILS